MVSGGSIPQYRPMISVELQAERVLVKMKKNFFAGGLFFAYNTFVEKGYYGEFTVGFTQLEREFNRLPRAERVRIMNEYYKWQNKFHDPVLKKQSNSGNSGIIYCPYVPAIISTNTGP